MQTGGERFLPSSLFFLSMSALGLGYVVIMYTHRTTVLLCCGGLCDIRVLFMYDRCQCAWRIAPIRFNNVSLCTSIFIPNISGLLRRPRVLNRAVGLPVGCANHYTIRTTRNVVTSVGTIEVGLQSTQVSNSCRKWHITHISVLIHSPLYMAYSTLR